LNTGSIKARLKIRWDGRIAQEELMKLLGMRRMNHLVVSALACLALTTTTVGCGDDSDDVPTDGGMDGGGTGGKGGAGGKGGTGGKGGAGGKGGTGGVTAGTGGKGGTGGVGGKGGTGGKGGAGGSMDDGGVDAGI
jgi:hypothetical protein